MKVITLTTILFLTATFSFAQSFKDVYETLPLNDRFSNMMNLRHYQEQNPEHLIGYYLLGNIYDEYMREYDPLLLFSSLESDYLQLKTYYGLVKFKLDEKQARQDRDYYGEVELITDKKKIGLPDILNEIERKLNSAGEYYTNAKTVHDNYYRCINKYNECLFHFRKIVSDYPNYKNLYLLATPDLISDIQNIALNFDSALVFFDTYKASSESLTHLLKINNYKINPIVTYRLEGLIESDFTAEEVQLWDFKSWALNFLDLMNSDINSIRMELIRNDEMLDQQMADFLNNEEYSDEFDINQVDVKFQNLIGKYDHSSLCNDLLNYKKAKVDFLMHTRSATNNIDDSLSFFLINKLRFYRDLIMEKEALNVSVSEIKNTTSLDKVAKNIDFFGQRYNGMDGFLRWCEIEKYRNNTVFDSNVEHLVEFVKRDDEKFAFADSVLTYQKTTIPIGFQTYYADSLKSDTTLIENVFMFRKRWLYQYGFTINKDSVTHPFIVKISPESKVEWFNEPKYQTKVKTQNSKIQAIQVLDDSTCYMVEHCEQISNNTEIIPITFINSYNWKGKLIKQFSFESELTPTYYWFDEINETYVIVEQGTTLIDSLTELHPMCVRLYNSNDSLLWKQNFNLKGKVENVITTNSNFLIVCNYTDFSFDKTLLLQQNGATGIVSIYLNKLGNVEQINNYAIDGSLSVNNSFKLHNSSINIIGELSNAERNKLFYMLVDDYGKPEISNSTNLKYQNYKYAN